MHLIDQSMLSVNMKLLFILIIFFPSSITFPQQSKLSCTVNQLSAYIASEKFVDLKNKIGDVAVTDSIFAQAIKCTNGNISEALLALMFVTVPYREVPIQIPLINSIVNYPLISADEEIYLRKNENLPRYLFLILPKMSMAIKINWRIFLEVHFYLMNLIFLIWES